MTRILAPLACLVALGYVTAPGFEPTVSTACRQAICIVSLSSVEVLPGGATTLQVYRALEAHDLSFVGGRVGTVGMGGFTLGGGTSPFSNKYGWSLDNVYEYEAVLANGTIVNASESHNPDLYFALRGGGNNFAIVTAFTVRTFSQDPVFTSMTAYAENQSSQALDRVFDLYTDRNLTSDKKIGYDLYYTYSSASDTAGQSTPPLFFRLLIASPR